MNHTYAKETYFNNQVNTASQKKLIIMLYEGAIRNLKLAKKAMEENQIEKTNQYLIKSQNIVSELMNTLDLDAGGDIGKSLYQLYDYMYIRLVEANIHKDIDCIKEVEKYLKELKTSWEQI